MPMGDERKHLYAKEIEEIVDNMTLMDDDLMSRVFNQTYGDEILHKQY